MKPQKSAKIFVLCLSLNVCQSLKVCPSVMAYALVWPLSLLRCSESNLDKLNITETIKTWKNAEAEEIYLTTEDGYIILLEKLFFTDKRDDNKPPIIIVHGIAMNPTAFVNRGNQSLAKILIDEGHTVYLLSYRGTEYSKRHVKIKTTDRNFWTYNINDLGIHDVRTAIKYVNNETKKQPIYIGYSMGTTGFFVYSTTYPNEARNSVKGMIALAPVINYKDIKSMIKYFVPFVPMLKWLVYYFWHGEIFAGVSRHLFFLLRSPVGILLAQVMANLLFGIDNGQMNPPYLPVFISQSLDTAGAEVFTHYVQIYQSGVFQNYDYGRDENLELYGTPNPPVYNISLVSVPVAIFQGLNDWVATNTNAKQLYSELSPARRCGFVEIKNPSWSHSDYLTAIDVQKYLYGGILEKIKQISTETCHG